MNSQYYILAPISPEAKIIFWLDEKTIESAHRFIYTIESDYPTIWVEGERVKTTKRWINIHCACIIDPKQIKQLDKRRLLMGI